MTPSIYPFLQYRDAPAALAWLEQAFGFKTVMSHADGKGGIAHAELQLGQGMVMLGSRQPDGPFALSTPQEAGCTTQGVYIVVKDIDALFARAKAAGARIVMEIRDTDYGSRDFSARDPEGHLWSFGTYAPAFTAD
ncbi:VOC family protein [Ferrovibrio terrae]|uniref:VOC family protein n=1 Tax=Ferrovibrio terrae TaxID=2594003 RepID=UPI00313821B0